MILSDQEKKPHPSAISIFSLPSLLSNLLESLQRRFRHKEHEASTRARSPTATIDPISSGITTAETLFYPILLITTVIRWPFRRSLHKVRQQQIGLITTHTIVTKRT